MFRNGIDRFQRLPRHWKLLFGSQFLFTLYAIKYRQKLIEQRRQELIAEENSMAKPDERNN